MYQKSFFLLFCIIAFYFFSSKTLACRGTVPDVRGHYHPSRVVVRPSTQPAHGLQVGDVRRTPNGKVVEIMSLTEEGTLNVKDLASGEVYRVHPSVLTPMEDRMPRDALPPHPPLLSLIEHARFQIESVWVMPDGRAVEILQLRGLEKAEVRSLEGDERYEVYLSALKPLEDVERRGIILPPPPGILSGDSLPSAPPPPDEERRCQLCWYETAAYYAAPCAHSTFCQDCSYLYTSNECPVCRQPMEGQGLLEFPHQRQ